MTDNKNCPFKDECSLGKGCENVRLECKRAVNEYHTDVKESGIANEVQRALPDWIEEVRKAS